ncbi:hypothetical protein TrCOL_g5301 [Triparma columacea]|uniref:Uncharacterized protein n=1 Tax=Triparma columacea TaxID=722753 RepID=A0A9W7LDJ5_9STRA|nr:hypothetical protein TrCOL_g5301 [Triparma columacea]
MMMTINTLTMIIIFVSMFLNVDAFVVIKTGGGLRPKDKAGPRVASFPQRAETYLRATKERGQFAQAEASLLVGVRGGERAEPQDLTRLRKETNAKSLPCYTIVNGHAILMGAGGRGVEGRFPGGVGGGGGLHWDT